MKKKRKRKRKSEMMLTRADVDRYLREATKTIRECHEVLRGTDQIPPSVRDLVLLGGWSMIHKASLR